MNLIELSRSLVPSFLPPLSGNIYCVGRNYADHITELKNEAPKEPVIFLKAPSALRTMDSSPVAWAEESFHHEIELVLLIGKAIEMGRTADESAVQGISLGLDLTRRERQNELKAKGLPWTLAKSFAGSGVLHPFVTFPREQTLDFKLFVNDELRQSGQSSDMIFNFRFILNFLLKYQNLYPGDIIFTGTPAGVAAIRQGDKFRFASKALAIDAQGRL
jgi:fumarylpyruvate hydrolase